MTADIIKQIAKRAWIIILKIWNVLCQGLRMLWPDKTFSSRLCFGMAFICTTIFIINAVFTLSLSCALLISELAFRADKELKMAKMICDREQAKTDTITTDQLFNMIMASGIDNKYTLCLTDSVDSIVACNKKGINLKNGIVPFLSTDDGGHVELNMDEISIKIVLFNNTVNMCLNDTIANSTYRIQLIEPLDEAMTSVEKIVKKVGVSSLACFCLLVICYLIMLFLLRRTTSRNEQIEGELDIAASIQKQMVPLDFSVFPERHGYNLHGFLQPAKTMGGDLLDYVLHDDKLFFCIGDVSGKGMPAALFMSEVHVLFHHILAFEHEPAHICAAINNSMSENNDSNMFCTLFLGVIDFKTNILSYCNAGHNPPATINSEGKAEFLSVEPNIALGLIADFPYQSQQIEFPTDSTLVTYTDGVTEAESLNKKLLGDEAMLSILANKHLLNPDEIIHLITSKISEHTMLADQSDDITLLVLKRMHNSADKN